MKALLSVDDRDRSHDGRGHAYAVLPASDCSALETDLLDRQQDDVQAPVSLHQGRGQSKLHWQCDSETQKLFDPGPGVDCPVVRTM